MKLNEEIYLAVNGTLMRGLQLNENLLAVNAEFIREDKTSDHYRMWSIKDRYPAMMRDFNMGANIDLEIWRLSPVALLEILRSEPPGLCLGKVQLIDDQWVFGILGESDILNGMQEITEWGGWRNYLNQKKI